MAQQLGSGNLNVSAAWVRSENWLEDNNIDFKSHEAINQLLAQEFRDWDERLVKFLQVMDLEHVISRNLYMLPVGTRWKNRPGVTLIGDAAHLMTPYAGEGVNLAMADSMKLAEAIIAASKQSEEASETGILTAEVEKFEEDMFTRATKYQEMTFEMMSYMLFEPGAPYSTIEKYLSTAMAHDLPWGVRPFVVGAIHVFYWFYKRFFLPNGSG
jgi:2-polyprenyl-6-methoxyphenol hydroxylase-like FAD-dependent oxidoreductase